MSENTTPQAQDSKYESNPFLVTFKGFDKLFKYNQTPAIVLLIISVVLGFGRAVFSFIPPNKGTAPTPLDTVGSPAASPHGPEIIGLIAVIVLIALVVFSAVYIVMTIYTGFISYVTYKTSRNETTTFSEGLSAVMKKLSTLLWVRFLVFLKIFGGLILFVVPGIRAMLRYQMVDLVVFGDNVGAREAMRRIRFITKDHLIEIFGVSTVGSIIPVVGQLLIMGGQSVMYPQLNELKRSDAPKPKVHWLNYLAFILLGGFILFALLIAIIIIAFISYKF